MSSPDGAAEQEGPLGLLTVNCREKITFSQLIIQVIFPIYG